MLKVPICTFDAKTGILCPKCKSKLEKGQISQDDVNLSIKLVSLIDSIPELDKISLHHALKFNSNYILIVGAGESRLLKNYDTLQKLERELKGKVWIIEGHSNNRKFLEDLFYPIRILSINTVFLPDGSELTKVIIMGRKNEKLLSVIEQIKQIAKMVKGMDLLVEFERT
ncbi:hypothetical protein HRbin06_00073 [archaeon HR06]|nr:hypothetical protein HRbin06_00073 [archaeon HR06]